MRYDEVADTQVNPEPATLGAPASSGNPTTQAHPKLLANCTHIHVI